ncbi:hypothetical protein WA026_010042 [Henosepilachna vigintioctopunctata]|uniref:Uncharacterized protein n=1 Tax=Henosepilachna vigintioctopunctata TaxID=420089 RepID=A0AAW1UL99_9CUCU
MTNDFRGIRTLRDDGATTLNNDGIRHNGGQFRNRPKRYRNNYSRLRRNPETNSKKWKWKESDETEKIKSNNIASGRANEWRTECVKLEETELAKKDDDSSENGFANKTGWEFIVF